MILIKVKPLSVNACYQGRRFSTPKHKAYKEELAYILPTFKIPSGKLRVEYHFGVSSKQADGDNLMKAFQDCLAEKYGFNDRDIYEWKVIKVDVEKGAEYISFEINKY